MVHMIFNIGHRPVAPRLDLEVIRMEREIADRGEYIYQFEFDVGLENI